MTKAPESPRSRVDRYSQGTALPTSGASTDKVAQKEPAVKKTKLKDNAIGNSYE